jgi:hypothetical protein
VRGVVVDLAPDPADDFDAEIDRLTGLGGKSVL